jgi:uncharacterized protein
MSAPAQPTSGLDLRPPANHVSRRAIRYWTLRAVGTTLVVGVVEWAILFLGGPPIDHGRWEIVGVSAVLAAAYIVVMPRWRYAVHRWETTDTAAYTQSGWLNQERRIAPISRIQTIDSHRGPLEQILKLANVTVTTASAAGPLQISAIDKPVADRLVDDLTRRTEAEAGDAT